MKNLKSLAIQIALETLNREKGELAAEIERLTAEIKTIHAQKEADIRRIAIECGKAKDEIERLRAVILNIQSDAEKGFPIDTNKLATRCRRALETKP